MWKRKCLKICVGHKCKFSVRQCLPRETGTQVDEFQFSFGIYILPSAKLGHFGVSLGRRQNLVSTVLMEHKFRISWANDILVSTRT
jgi:hypothetical protein